MNEANGRWTQQVLHGGAAALLVSLLLASAGCGGNGLGLTASTTPATPTSAAANPPTATLTATPSSIPTGGTATLNWAAQNAQTITLNPGNVQLSGTSGTVSETPAQTTTYTLTAVGPGGTQQASATVTVSTVPTPQISLTASPATIASGASSTLTWATQSAQSVTLNGTAMLANNAPLLNGSMTVSPTQTTTYTAVATGLDGKLQASATATVTIAPAPTATFAATPGTIDLGQSSVLAWQTTNADVSVTLDGTAVATSGTWNVSPTKSAWYKLVATGTGGSVTQNVEVIVNQPPGSTASHVAIIVMENQNYGDVIGNTSGAPYINSLANTYGLAKYFYANSVGYSQPDYFMLTVGDTVYNGDNTSIIVTADNVVRELNKAGKTWKAYAENLPTHYLPTDPSYSCDSSTLDSAGLPAYACIHNPFVFLCDVNGASGCPVPYDPAQANNVVPYSQLASDISSGNLPDYIFVIPNNCDNTHDCSLGTGDSWLQANVPPLLGALGSNGFLVVTFDESGGDTTNGGGRIPDIIAGPTVIPGYVSTYNFYQHQSTLRLMMKALGVFSYPNAAASAPDMDEFFSVPLP